MAATRGTPLPPHPRNAPGLHVFLHPPTRVHGGGGGPARPCEKEKRQNVMRGDGGSTRSPSGNAKNASRPRGGVAAAGSTGPSRLSALTRPFSPLFSHPPQKPTCRFPRTPLP